MVLPKKKGTGKKTSAVVAAGTDSWQCDYGEVRTRLTALWTRRLWVDCELEVGAGERVSAHRVLLASASPVLAAMLYSSLSVRHDQPLSLPDIEPKIACLLLEYIYTDNINISSCDVSCSVYRAAHYLMIPHLEAVCSTYLHRNVMPDCVLRVYEFAKLFDENKLRKKCLKVISCDASAVLAAVGTTELPRADTLAELFALSELHVRSELELLRAAERWVLRQLASPAAGPAEGDSAGQAEGDPAGPAEGDPPGSTEGDSAGSTEGDSASPAEGDPAGPVEGDPAGPVEGDPAGPSEGDPAGPVEGDPAGPVEGDPAGPSEGDPAGPVEGDPAGPVEGDPAGPVEGDPAGPVEGDPAAPVEGDARALLWPALQQIRFLAMAPEEFTQHDMSFLLSQSEILAISFNLLNSKSPVPMPAGFSTSREPRMKDYIGAIKVTIPIINNEFRATVSDTIYLQKSAWKLAIDNRRIHVDQLPVHAMYYCNANIRVKVLSYNLDYNDYILQEGNRTSPNYVRNTFNHHYVWDTSTREELFDETKGYIHNGAITLEVQIEETARPAVTV